MTYLVLARKWRPRSFKTLVGQDHVVRALTHALSTQRLHHAWLFTGTRGVGKTTLSRILAKSLNCLDGITPSPCGVCQACTEIDAGRFVDYIELDAASNRGVDEMTQLLEQAVYAPSSGRYKVYMIDEVHMLSGHAFNAMLKTLEEPPPHVKFILATTDPQKIPVTVLSRCLQFNLKQMAAPAIVAYLEYVLAQEEIPYEVAALRLLAQAASGSMRDALSLTDQAIAYSASHLTNESIQGMLGAIDQRHLLTLLQALSDGSATQIMQVANQLADRGLSYSGALADLAILLSRIAIEQRVPGSVATDDPQSQEIGRFATQLHPDYIQLFYSVAVHSRAELSLAPDEYAGFVMACLRMLALMPGSSAPKPAEQLASPAAHAAGQSVAVDTTATAMATATAAVATDAKDPAAAPSAPDAPMVLTAAAVSAVSAAPTVNTPEPLASQDIPAWEDPPVSLDSGQPEAAQPESVQPESMQSEAVATPDKLTSAEAPRNLASAPDAGFETMDFDADDRYQRIDTEELDPASPDDSDPGLTVPVFSKGRKKSRAPKLRTMAAQDWPALAASLPLTGLAAQLARQSEWIDVHDDTVSLRVAIRTLAESPGKVRLQTLLSEHFGAVVRLDVQYGATGDATAHAVAQARQAERQEQAELAAQHDPFIQALVSDFGAHIVPGSVSATPAGQPSQ